MGKTTPFYFVSLYAAIFRHRTQTLNQDLIGICVKAYML